MSKEFYPPFIIIQVPVDIDGNGPVFPLASYQTLWHIWDRACQTVSSHETEAAAYAALYKIQESQHLDGGSVLIKDEKKCCKTKEMIEMEIDDLSSPGAYLCIPRKEREEQLRLLWEMLEQYKVDEGLGVP